MCPLRLAPLLLVAAACASARSTDPPLILRDVTVAAPKTLSSGLGPL
jgi:hypothetical protein